MLCRVVLILWQICVRWLLLFFLSILRNESDCQDTETEKIDEVKGSGRKEKEFLISEAYNWVRQIAFKEKKLKIWRIKRIKIRILSVDRERFSFILRRNIFRPKACKTKYIRSEFPLRRNSHRSISYSLLKFDNFLKNFPNNFSSALEPSSTKNFVSPVMKLSKIIQ